MAFFILIFILFQPFRGIVYDTDDSENPQILFNATSQPNDSITEPDDKIHTSDMGDMDSDTDGGIPCAHIGCSEPVFAACTNADCEALLCYDHFIDSICDNHGGHFKALSEVGIHPEDNQSSGSATITYLDSTHDIEATHEPDDNQRAGYEDSDNPEHFTVEGEPRESVTIPTPKKKRKTR